MVTLVPSFDLPPSIKALQSGWQTTFQSAATVSALLAAVEGQLFVFVEGLQPPTEGAVTRGSGPPKVDLSSPSGQALLCFTFLTFLLSIGATVSSLILSDQVAELPVRGYETKDTIDKDAEIKGTGMQIMVTYGLESSLSWFMWHWLSMLILGYLSLLVQIVIYVSLTQTRLVNILVGVGTFWVLLPLIAFLLPSRRQSIRHDYVKISHTKTET